MRKTKKSFSRPKKGGGKPETKEKIRRAREISNQSTPLGRKKRRKEKFFFFFVLARKAIEYRKGACHEWEKALYEDRNPDLFTFYFSKKGG
jgi:hypothetical protein